jgi:hypothetical protein
MLKKIKGYHVKTKKISIHEPHPKTFSLLLKVVSDRYANLPCAPTPTFPPSLYPLHKVTKTASSSRSRGSTKLNVPPWFFLEVLRLISPHPNIPHPTATELQHFEKQRFHKTEKLSIPPWFFLEVLRLISLCGRIRAAPFTVK